MRVTIPFLAAAAAAFLATAAQAEPIVDQQQTEIDAAAGYLGIGGAVEQQLAQTFTVGRTGDLVGLRLPIMGCGRGDLAVEIVEVDADGRPSDRVLASVTVAPEDLPPASAGFVDILFDPPLAVTTGQRLAFTLRMEPPDANCSLATAPEGDLYGGGDSYYDSRSNPPGWIASRETSRRRDLPFQTLMDNLSPPGGPGGSSRYCDIPAAGGFQLPAFVPVCRCLEDPGLREFRCALLHPDFFMIRRIPFPLSPGQYYAERWEFYPATRLSGPVRMTLEGSGLEKPVARTFGAQAKSGQVERFAVKAVAPKSMAAPGRARIEYEMKGAEAEIQKRFETDRSLDKSLFEKP